MKITKIKHIEKITQTDKVEDTSTKKLIIMRGLPGSGKSTLAKQLSEGGALFSTDEFFMKNGKYVFNGGLIGKAHMWNQDRVEKAMASGISPVVVDNTNVVWAHIKPYVDMAKKYGYVVSYEEPTTDWKFNADELAKKNTHGVPIEAIKGMLDKWQKTETFPKQI